MTNSDFGELVWENGHIVIKGGQFSKVSDAPNMDIFTNSKTGNLTNEAIGRYDDGDVFPWFYHLDDPLHHDSASGFLAETSGVTSNGLQLQCFTKFSVAHKLSNPSPCSGSRVSSIAGNGVSKHTIKSDSLGDQLYEMRLEKKQDKQVQASNFTLFGNVARARNDPESAWARSNEKIITHGTVAKDGLLKETNGLTTDATRKCSPSESVDKQTKPKLGEDGLKLNSVNGRNERVETKKIREPTAAPPSLCSDNNGLRASNYPTNFLKRKHIDEEDCDSSSEDAEEESIAVKKAGCKRNRAAEVHNFTERKRREEINDKMRSLQELLPNCNKIDKATMLDEVIEYLRMLQFQVQMMTMRPQMCTSPIIPQSGLQHLQAQTHLQQFMPIGFGMGMGYQSACFPGPSNPPQQLWNAAQRIPMPMPPLPGVPQTLIPGSAAENPNSQNTHLV